MKKPNFFLRVFGLLVPVYKVPELIEKEEALGLYHIEDIRDPRPLIMIDEKLSADEFNKTLIHEMFHATMNRTHLTGQISDEMEEIIVDQFATVVIENFKLQLKTAA